MNPIKGTLKPLRDNILVYNMEFGMERTKSGLYIQSDDGKGSGVHPRWAQVFAVGKDQSDVKVGDWLLLEHGRWSRGVEHKTEDGKEITVHLADKEAILLVSDEKPSDVIRSSAVGAGSNVNFNIPKG